MTLPDYHLYVTRNFGKVTARKRKESVLFDWKASRLAAALDEAADAHGVVDPSLHIKSESIRSGCEPSSVLQMFSLRMIGFCSLSTHILNSHQIRLLCSTSHRKMASSSGYKVILCADAHQLREAHRIRMSVFHEEQGFPADVEVDEYDPLSAHFLLVPNEDGAPSSQSASTAAAPAGTGTTKASTEADDVVNQVRAVGVLRWVPYPTSKIPAVLKEAAKGSSSSLLPLGRPPTSQGPLAASFASAGGAKLGRLALDRSVRGKGLGARLVRESEEWVVKALGEKVQKEGSSGEKLDVTFRLHSQMQVVGFYKGLGYHQEGEPFDEDGAPHLLCVKRITIG